MPEVILPCPAWACQGELVESKQDGENFYIECTECGMRGPVEPDPYHAQQSWDWLPRALRWTHEPPKVAGWYFQRTAGEDQTINVAYVYSGLAGLYCKCGCRNTPLKCWIGFEWAGPIAPPID